MKTAHDQTRNLSEKQGAGICPECLAGNDDVPYEQICLTPAWHATSGLEVPWDPAKPSPLLKIPHRKFAPQLFYRKDPFHIWKQSVGGHWTASAVVLLLDLGYWSVGGGSQSADKLLEVAYLDFAAYVKHDWAGSYTCNVKAFTKAIFHWGKIKMFPYTRIKGSDIMLMTRWLNFMIEKGLWDEGEKKRSGKPLVEHPLQASHAPMLKQLLVGCQSALDFWHILHSNGVWLNKSVANRMATKCHEFCRAYYDLAVQCHTLKLRRFHLEPSLHYMHHFAVDTFERVALGDRYIMSPNCDNCECDEDFVGRIARLSRAVHPSSVTQRTLQRYCIKAFFNFEGQDYGALGPKQRKRKLRHRA